MYDCRYSLATQNYVIAFLHLIFDGDNLSIPWSAQTLNETSFEWIQSYVNFTFFELPIERNKFLMNQSIN